MRTLTGHPAPPQDQEARGAAERLQLQWRCCVVRLRSVGAMRCEHLPVPASRDACAGQTARLRQDKRLGAIRSACIRMSAAPPSPWSEHTGACALALARRRVTSGGVRCAPRVAGALHSAPTPHPTPPLQPLMAGPTFLIASPTRARGRGAHFGPSADRLPARVGAVLRAARRASPNPRAPCRPLPAGPGSS